MSANISRNTFLRSACLVGSGAIIGLSLQNTGQALATESQNNYDADIIVVGTGLAGLSAAVEAAELGASVLLVDKCADGAAGGNSIVSEGGFATPIDNSAESIDAFFEASMSISRNEADENLLRVLSEHAFDDEAWLENHGCTFWFDYKMPAYPVVTHLLESTFDAIQNLITAFTDQGGTIAYDTRLLNFCLDEKTGRVNGITVLDGTGIHNLHAKAVIVCTGGYAAGKQYLEQFVGDDGDRTICRGRPHLTGDGIAPILSVGGELVNARGEASIHLACVLPVNPGLEPAGLMMSGIAVNAEGKRYVDEGPSYQAVGKATSKQPGAGGYGIWDEELMGTLAEQCAEFESVGGLIVHKADSVEELAEKMGLPVETLAATVQDFNDHVNDDGTTSGLEINKTAEAKKLVPPLYGSNELKCGCAVTFGGIRINTQGQVLRADGTVIDGLYAAGELTGGFFHYDYIGGSSIARCVSFGRIAAQNAVNELGEIA